MDTTFCQVAHSKDEGFSKTIKNKITVKKDVDKKTIRYIDMFSGIGGFREGFTRAGGFRCVGHCEIDKHADRSYRALFNTNGEWFCEDATKAEPKTMPDFDLLCGGFPCQSYAEEIVIPKFHQQAIETRA